MKPEMKSGTSLLFHVASKYKCNIITKNWFALTDRNASSCEKRVKCQVLQKNKKMAVVGFEPTTFLTGGARAIPGSSP